MKVMRVVMAMAAGCAAVWISASPGLAAEPSPEEMGRVVKVPETAADHLALAKGYEDKAAAWRKEAAYHREMATAYSKTHPDPKGGRNPWAEKMERHCMSIVKDADKLAADAKVAADYHHLRARELQGK